MNRLILKRAERKVLYEVLFEILKVIVNRTYYH